MSEEIEEQVKEALLASQLIDRKVETALNYILNTNPVDKILKQIGSEDESIRKDAVERVKVMMNEWLESYSSALKEGKTLPRDLLGSAADLAKKMRNKQPDEVS